MSLTDQLIGSWRLDGARSRTTDGQSIPSIWGDQPAGNLIYTAEGRMSVHVLRTDRLAFATEDARSGTIEEMRSCFEGYCAYYGTFEIDEQQMTVTHFVERDLIPNYDGDSLTRHIHLDGDTLTLTTPPTIISGKESVSDLIWVRL